MIQRPERGRHQAVSALKASGALDLLLPGRLVLAAILLAVALLVKMPVAVKVILLVLSALASGYDLALTAFEKIMSGDYFATPIVVLFVTFVSFLVGFGAESAAMLILYQLSLLAIPYVEKRARKSAFGLLDGAEQETAERAKELYGEKEATALKLEPTVFASADFVLKIMMVLALVYAIVLPLIGPYGFRISIHRALMILLACIPGSVVLAMPVTALVGLCFSARNKVLFKEAKSMERAADVNVAVFDKAGVFSAGEPTLQSTQSDVMDARTFMSIVAHAVYYSEQSFAKAIPALDEQDYKLAAITDFVDIPGQGVELKIGNNTIILASAAYQQARGVSVPQNDAADGETYYLSISGRYAGQVTISSEVNDLASELVEGFREVGVQEAILVTEDGAGESRRLAEELGMDDVYGECDMEKKLRHIEDLSQSEHDHVMFVYANGIETHSAADLDVRLSQRAKYADVCVAPENASELPFALEISRRMMEVAKENAIFVFAVKALMIFLSMIGANSIWFVLLMDTVAVIATLLNTIRVTKPPIVDLRKITAPKQDLD